MPDLTWEELQKSYGLDDRSSVAVESAPTKELSWDELQSSYGLAPTATAKEPSSDQTDSFIGSLIKNTLAETSVGIAARATGAVDYEPKDLGTGGNIAAGIGSFVLDPATYLTGGLGSIIGKSAAKKLVAHALAKKLIPPAVSAGVQLGGLEAVKEAAAGEFHPGEIAKATIAGAAFGPAGLAPKGLRTAAEVVAMGAVPPALEGRLPTGDDWVNAAGTVGGFKLYGVIKKAIGRLKPDAKPEEVKAAIEAEIGPEEAAKLEAAIAVKPPEPPVAPPVEVAPVNSKLAALADKETVSRKDYAEATGTKVGHVPVAAVRKAEAVAAAEQLKQESINAETKAPEIESAKAAEEVPQAQGEVGDVLVEPTELARPDLSRPFKSEAARIAVNEADIARNAAGEPKEIGRDAQDVIAEKNLAENPDYWKSKLLNGEAAATETGDTATYKKIIDSLPEGKELSRAVMGWREAGEVQGREFEARKMTGQEGQRFFAREAVFLPSEKAHKKIRRAQADVKKEAAEEARRAKVEPKLPEPTLFVEPPVEPVRSVEAPKIVEPVLSAELPSAKAAKPVASSESLKAAQKHIDDLWTEIVPKWTGKQMYANPVLAVPELIADAVRLAHAYAVREGVRFADFYKDVKRRIGNDRAKSLRPTLSQAWKQAQSERKAVEPSAAHKLRADEIPQPEGRVPAPAGTKLPPKPKVQGPETEKSYIARQSRAAKRLQELDDAWQVEVTKIKSKLAGMGHNVEAAMRGELDPGPHQSFIRDAHALKATTPDKVYEAWRSGLVSGPATQVVNMSGTAFQAGWYFTAERMADAFISSAARAMGYKNEGAYFGEVKILARALLPSLAKGWHSALATWRTEIPQFHASRGRPNEALYDYTSPAIAGKLGRFVRGYGFRPLSAVDDGLKTGIALMEAEALAFRQAKLEKLSGKAMQDRITGLLNDPRSDVNLRATDVAVRLALQESSTSLKKITDITKMEGVRWVIPFTTAPFNIFKTGIRKSPFGALSLAKEMWKASDTGDWSKVSTRAAEQVLAWGTTLALFYGNDPAAPWITGGTDPNRKYSVKIGGQWYYYGRVEPFASMLGLLVDSINKIHQGGDMFDALKAPFDALADRIDNQTFFAGVSDFLKAAQYGDVNYVLKWASKFPASFVPNLVRAPIRNIADEVPERRVWGKGQAKAGHILKRGMQSFEVMPDYPKYDLWGRAIPKDGSPIPHTDWLFRTLSPVGERKYVETIGDRILTRWNAAHPEDRTEFKVPNPYFTEDGKTFYFTDAEYAQYVRESGKLTQQRIIAAQAGGAFNIDKPTERDIERLRKIIETSRARIRNAIKRARRKEAA